VADLEPPITEFNHRVRAGDGDEAARVLLEIDRDHLWEWDHKALLRQFYTTIEHSPIHDTYLAHQVARRRAWLKFFEAPQEADREFEALLQEARRIGVVKLEADALDDLAQTCRRGNRDLLQGIAYHRQALALYRQVGDRRGEADALGGIGAIYTQIEPEEAVDCLLAAADIHRELGNRSSLSFVLTMLGAAYRSLGVLEQAAAVLEEAVQVARDSGSLEALGRACGGMAIFCASQGDITRGRAWIEEALAVTREFAGLPISGNLMFFLGETALYMALAGDPASGIALFQGAFQDIIAVLPQLIQFANLLLSPVVMLSGDFQQARSLLPADLETMVARSSGNTFWIGALLIKTGEARAAASFFNRVLELSTPDDSQASDFQHLRERRHPMRALAYAGLALLNNDLAMAATAADHTHRVLRVRHWHLDLYRALIDLLIQEPGGEILLPIREILASFPAHL
jgi:tetratricopeptide (TPR) repeat protein